MFSLHIQKPRSLLLTQILNWCCLVKFPIWGRAMDFHDSCERWKFPSDALVKFMSVGSSTWVGPKHTIPLQSILLQLFIILAIRIVVPWYQLLSGSPFCFHVFEPIPMLKIDPLYNQSISHYSWFPLIPPCSPQLVVDRRNWFWSATEWPFWNIYNQNLMLNRVWWHFSETMIYQMSNSGW